MEEDDDDEEAAAAGSAQRRYRGGGAGRWPRSRGDKGTDALPRRRFGLLWPPGDSSLPWLDPFRNS
eukprot:1081998-Pyramimonas_sp.AAC.1